MNKKYGVVDYLAYACASMVYILPQYLLSSFLSAYYTDVALISGAAVGTVVLMMRFTDGISDLIMGRVIDKTKSKWGKARPWLFIGTIGLAIFLLCTFHVPSALGNGAKIFWLAVTYFMVMTIFSTVQGVSANTMIIYMTDESDERSKFGASNMAGVYIGGMVATTLTAVLLGKLGYDQQGYDKVMFFYALLILIFGFFSFARLKESRGQGKNEAEKQQGESLRTILSAMVKNKYYVGTIIVGLMANLMNGITTGMGIYFCRDIFGNANYYVMITLVLLLPTLIFLPLAVAISRKIGRHRSLMLVRYMGVIGSIIQAVGVMTAHILPYFIGTFVCGFGNAFFAACFTARVADVCDYGEYKYHTNASGIMMSATSFCNKIGLGLGAAVTGIILSWAKYDGLAASQGLMQSAYTISVEKYAVAVLPIVCQIIMLIYMHRSNVDPYMDEVRKGL